MILYVISVGLSVTMGLMGFINLAHGVFAMAGGYIFSTVMARLGVPFPLALLVAFVAVALASIVLERLLYSRLYTRGRARAGAVHHRPDLHVGGASRA